MRGYDLMGNVEEAERWLAEADYRVETAITEAELKRLRELRESLRSVLVAHTSGVSEQPRRSASRLNELCAPVNLRPDFTPEGEPRLVASSEGLERLVEDLLAAAVWAHHTGLWGRLKVCANEDCRWAFYDHSKNRSGNWCVMEICGSRAKMRAYRQRHSLHSPPSSQ